jgi:hypothetical protein
MAGTQSFTVTVQGREMTFLSHLTDEQAIAHLCMLTSQGIIRSQFAFSLLSQAHNLSAKQLAWVHKIVIDNEPRTPQPVAPPALVLYPNITKMFAFAGEKLVCPKLSFDMDGTSVELKKVADTAKNNPRQVYVYMDKEYRGRIDQSGAFVPRIGWNVSDIITVLRNIEACPQEFAKNYGLQTGFCCFCCKKLTTEQSLKCGYGPVCAKNFNLQY